MNQQITINLASLEIVARFMDILEDKIVEMLKGESTLTSATIPDENGNVKGAIIVILKRSGSKKRSDRKKDYPEIEARLTLDGGFELSHKACQIPMAYSHALYLMGKYESNPDNLFHEVCQIRNGINPSVEEWFYDEKSQLLKASYTDFYRTYYLMNTEDILKKTKD